MSTQSSPKTLLLHVIVLASLAGCTNPPVGVAAEPLRIQRCGYFEPLGGNGWDSRNYFEPVPDRSCDPSFSHCIAELNAYVARVNAGRETNPCAGELRESLRNPTVGRTAYMAAFSRALDGASDQCGAQITAQVPRLECPTSCPAAVAVPAFSSFNWGQQGHTAPKLTVGPWPGNPTTPASTRVVVYCAASVTIAASCTQNYTCAAGPDGSSSDGGAGDAGTTWSRPDGTSSVPAADGGASWSDGATPGDGG